MSPSNGSVAGGTVLTIKGKGFDKHAKSVSVQVAGIVSRSLLPVVSVLAERWRCSVLLASLCTFLVKESCSSSVHAIVSFPYKRNLALHFLSPSRCLDESKLSIR